MERFISDLVKEFESGKIDRRKFCETVALAAVVYAAGESAANAAPAEGFEVIAINHLSYRCPDYRVARDFYASVFGMEVAPNKQGLCSAPSRVVAERISSPAMAIRQAHPGRLWIMFATRFQIGTKRM